MRFSIVRKIEIPFGLVVLLLMATALVSLVAYDRTRNEVEQLRQEIWKQSAAANLRNGISTLLMDVNDYIITEDGKYPERYREHRGDVTRLIEKLRRLSLREPDSASLARIESGMGDIHKIAEQILSITAPRSNAEAGRLMETMDYQYGESVFRETDRILESVAAQVESAHTAVRQSAREARVAVVGTVVIGVGIVFFVLTLTVRRISKSLLELVEMAERISCRDFSSHVTAASEDEISLLIRAFNAMADEINRRYEELENFAYLAAHDLRSPINTVKGFSEILLSKKGEQLDSESRQFLRRIAASSERMITLISGLLEFARAGKIEFAKKPISMNTIVDQVTTDIAPTVAERKARVTVAPSLPAVMCDPIRFSQVWKNLITNALKYNESSNPAIEIGCASENGEKGCYKFFVRDNGIGIDHENVEKIFMPFQRGAVDSKYEGTGLGLAIVKRVVEYHGGRVWAESTPGMGTIFYFTLPRPRQG